MNQLRYIESPTRGRIYRVTRTHSGRWEVTSYSDTILHSAPTALAAMEWAESDVSQGTLRWEQDGPCGFAGYPIPGVKRARTAASTEGTVRPFEYTGAKVELTGAMK